ncbi:histidine kinase dimerization/phosphoacceptor domain -containing protein [Azohydromonas caseinilytica]|uniref:GAF domain-containing protein n=1 Tax=Azohydromonas caseinilytica TaxID=2728836 RepID=A0A848FBE8_9BURK|nr:histidine kinase dimerization/phosphoacceptor domain -containing protein [Azohydromonas caseinilytica]NML15643.1 GAF domain-containing protein [Azohydromonas caseinilytica]
MRLHPPPARCAIALALGLLLLVAALALWAQHEATQAADQRQHMVQLRLDLAQLKADATEVPRTLGAYTLTGRDEWLQLYRQASTHVPERMRRLQALTAGDPAQRQGLQRLVPAVEALLRFYADMFDTASREGVEAARRSLAEAAGRGFTRRVHAVVDELDAEAARLQALRDTQARRDAALSTAVMLLGSALSLLLFASAALAFRRGAGRLQGSIAELTQAQASLRQANDALHAQSAHLAELNEALWKSVSERHAWGSPRPGTASAPAPLDDPARLVALKDTGLLDSAAEESFDRFTRLAAQTLNVPVSLISLVDDHRQFFKSAAGLAEPWASRRQTPLSHSFCQHVVTTGAPLVVADARQDPRLRDNGAVRDLGVTAYLGVPLATPEGHVLGSFCAIDSRPRPWSEQDRVTMERIAQSVLASIAVRMQLQALERRVHERSAEARMLADAIEHSLNGFYMVDAELRFTYANAAYCRMVGCGDPARLLGRSAEAYCADPHQHRRILGELGERGASQQQYTARREDGSTFAALTHAHRVSGEDGAPVYAVSVIDITERQRAQDAMRASLAEKEVLLQEIHHRVKNNLQVVSSLLQLQRRQQRDPALRDVFLDAENRVRAMALVHERLYRQQQLSALDFGDYLRGLVEQLLRSHGAGKRVALALELQPLLLPVGAAIPLALITSELVTNALKYAYQDRDTGELRITLRSEGAESLRLEVADDGPGLAAGFDPQTASSLGVRLVLMLAQQLGAEVEFRRGPGACCRLTAPVRWRPVQEEDAKEDATRV